MSAVKTFLLGLAFAVSASAHVGSPDVFFQGHAGPYLILVAIRPPEVIPGIAHIEVRALSGDVNRVELTPTPMTGEASKHPPVADVAERSPQDPRFYEGAVWLMGFGSWEVHVRVSGTKGSGELLVPVAAIATRASSMQKGTGWFLFGMMLFLSAGLVAIVGASVRESRLEPGVIAGSWNAKAWAWVAFTGVLVAGFLWGGKMWWAHDAATYSRRLYKPVTASAVLDAPDHLQLRLTEPGWMTMRKLDDLVPDHGHLMHLFLIRWPAMDQAFHLHPDQTATGSFGTEFGSTLPSLPGGRYRIYGDIVHETGLAETAVGEVDLPAVQGQPLSGDDAGGASVPEGDAFPLGAGYRMIWRRPETPVIARQLTLFTFAIAGPDGQEVTDLQPYMGMGGHAEFVRRDGSVFAHMHPTGSVPMAALDVASPDASSDAGMMGMHQESVGPEVSFPYGIPTAGEYRIFVQMKRAGKVETGAFAVTVR